MKKFTLFSILFLAFFSFLSFNVSKAEAATLYYNNGAGDNNWNTRINSWWTDAGFTLQAPALPTPSDDVIISATIASNTGPAASVQNLTIDGNLISIQNINVTVSGVATFNTYTQLSTGANIIGNAVFNNTSYNTATITGNATFNDTSYNIGTVTGNAVFTPASGGTITLTAQSWGTVNGTIKGGDDVALTDFIFNGASSENHGTINGNATFNTGSNNFTNGIVIGLATFNNASLNYGAVTGDPIFNNTSENNGTVTGNATFNDSSENNDTVTGNAIFNGNLSVNAVGFGTVSGTKTRHFTSSVIDTHDYATDGPWTVQADGAGVVVDLAGAAFDGTTTFQELNEGSFINGPFIYWFNDGVDNNWETLTDNWWDDPAHTIQAGSLPTGSSIVITLGASGTGPSVDLDTWTEPLSINASATGITFTSAASTTMSVSVTGNAIFNGSSKEGAGFTITGDAEFHNGSELLGVVTGNAYFYNTSTHGAHAETIEGDAYFYGNSKNKGNVVGDAFFADSSQNDIDGVVAGIATFSDSSINASAGIVNNDAIFVDSSRNLGTVTGNATFSNLSYNDGTVSVNAIFNDSSYNAISDGSVEGDATFNDLSYNEGSVTGTAKFMYATGGVATIANGGKWAGGTSSSNIDENDVVITSWVFNGNSLNDGTVSGDATFNNSSQNISLVTGDAVFNNSSQNAGTVSVDAVFNHTSSNNATVSGNAMFFDNTVNYGDVVGDACFAPNALNYGTVGGDTSVCPVSLPTVVTNSYLNINSSASTIIGEITNTGGDSSTVTGVQYGLSAPAYGVTVSNTGSFNAGTFGVIAHSLSCATTYHYRVFSTNSAGTSYSSDDTFTTSVCTGATSVLYGVSGTGENPDTPSLYTIDPATGDATFVGLTYYYLTGLAFHPDTGVLYGVSGNTGSNKKSLFTVNTNTGVATLLGALDDDGGSIVLPDISFRSDGRLYGVTNGDSLYEVDYDSCNGTNDLICSVLFIGNTGEEGDGGFGLAFDDSDNLFLLSGLDVVYYQIDPDTGLSTATISFSNSSNEIPLGAAAFNENDVLFSVEANNGASSDLIAIDQNTNTIISAGSNQDMNYISSLAFKITPAPEGVSHSSGGGGSTRRTIPAPVPTVCPVGHLFSTTTGLPCTSFTSTTTPTTPSSCVITQTLRQGDKGDQVKCLQAGLKILSDGIFGPITKASVITFQKLHSLVPDGIFGPKSLAEWLKK